MTQRVTALCTAAESALLAGDGRRAAGLLAEALPLAADPATRTEVLCLRGRVAMLNGDQPAALAELRAAADALAGTDDPDDGPLAARLLVEATVIALYQRHPDALTLAQRAYALSSGAADALLRARAATVLGIAYNYHGQPELGRRYLQRSADVIRLGGAPHEVVDLLQQVIVGLAGLECYPDALALCRQYAAAIRSVGATGVLPLVLCLLANSAYFTAEFDVVEIAAAEALRLARAQGQQPAEVYAHACLALAFAVTGEAESAREHADATLELVARTGIVTFASTAHLALGLIALADGAWPDAAREFGEVGAALGGLPTVSGTLHWRADEVEALWRCGELAAARAALAALVADTAATGATGPWEQAAAARVGALLGPDEDAERHFAAALAAHTRSSSPFETARTQLCWGEWLLARGRDAAALTHLRDAQQAFTRVGARTWAGRAGALLEPAARRAGTDAPPGAPVPGPSGPAVAATAVRAFGPLTLLRGGTETPVGMDTPGRALRYLAAAPGPVRAEELAEQLWPDGSSGHGNRLRTVLSRVRARYGPVVVRDGSVIRWSEGVSVDAQQFAGLARDVLSGPRDDHAAELARRAVALYREDLLPLERDAEWAAAARERLRQRYLELLARLVEDAVERDDLPLAIGYARQITDANPLDIEAHLLLARLQLDAGRNALARETLARAAAALAELGLDTPAELARLDRRARSAGAGSRSAGS